MKAQTAGFRPAELLFGTARRRQLTRAAQASIALAGDALMCVSLVLSGLLAWSPRVGIAAAKETLAARRAHRQRIAEIERLHGAVWARHARRDMPSHSVRLADRPGHPTSDP